MTRFRIVLMLCILTAFTPIVANSQSADYAPGEVLVKFKDGITRKSAEDLHKALGAEILHHVDFIGVDHVRIAAAKSVQNAIDEYMAQPDTEFAEPNYYRYLQGLPSSPFIPNDPSFRDQWGLHNTGQNIQGTVGTIDADIDAPEAWRFPTSNAEVVVAVIDSGVGWLHPDLRLAIWVNPIEIWNDGIDNDGNRFIDDTFGWDFVDNDSFPLDNNTHGSHVSGIVGAIFHNQYGSAGVAPGVKILPVRVADTFGRLTSLDTFLAYEYVATLKSTGAPIEIINTSFGSSAFSSFDNLALSVLQSLGLLICASAGNNGSNADLSPNYPANYDYDNIISVAATNSRDELSLFSNWGSTSVDLAAPGDQILSTIPYHVEISEDFSNGVGHWTQDGSPLTWGIEHVEGNATLSDSPGLNYANNTNTYVYQSSPISIGDALAVQFKFTAYYDLESDSFGNPYDYASFVVSDGGFFEAYPIYQRTK